MSSQCVDRDSPRFMDRNFTPVALKIEFGGLFSLNVDISQPTSTEQHW